MGNCSFLEVLELQIIIFRADSKISGFPNYSSITAPKEQQNLRRNIIIVQELDEFGNSGSWKKNILTGEIPSWIGDSFQKLSIVSLRFNKFSGELPSGLSKLS